MAWCNLINHLLVCGDMSSFWVASVQTAVFVLPSCSLPVCGKSLQCYNFMCNYQWQYFLFSKRCLQSIYFANYVKYSIIYSFYWSANCRESLFLTIRRECFTAKPDYCKNISYLYIWTCHATRGLCWKVFLFCFLFGLFFIDLKESFQQQVWIRVCPAKTGTQCIWD